MFTLGHTSLDASNWIEVSFLSTLVAAFALPFKMLFTANLFDCFNKQSIDFVARYYVLFALVHRLIFKTISGFALFSPSFLSILCVWMRNKQIDFLPEKHAEKSAIVLRETALRRAFQVIIAFFLLLGSMTLPVSHFLVANSKQLGANNKNHYW